MDMGLSRYELSDVQWGKIEDFLPGRKEHVVRTAEDNRCFVNGVLWMLLSGARWQDLPERCGKYKSLHKRFSRWAKSGVWEKVFHALLQDRKNQYLMIVRARPRAVKKGLRQGSGAFPRRPDDQNPSAGRQARPAGGLRRHRRAGQRLQAGHRFARRAKTGHVLADKGYDTDAIVEQIAAMGATVMIPPKSNRKVQREYDKQLYKQRNRIERCFSKLKQFHRFAARYEKNKENFLALVALACSWITWSIQPRIFCLSYQSAYSTPAPATAR